MINSIFFSIFWGGYSIFFLVIIFIAVHQQEVVSNDEIVGMSRDEECDRFNEEWNRTAGLHLPTRPRIHPSMLPHLESPYGQLQPQQSSTRQIQAVDENNQEQQPSRSNRTYRRQQYG